MPRYDTFQSYRSKMNCRILGSAAERGMHPDGSPRLGATLVTKRFFSLDAQTYQEGALTAKTKELLGLVASLVLRCDDCITYHIDQCVKAGTSDEELWETFDIGLIVGGSIVIPHVRRAVEFLDECRAKFSSNCGCSTHGCGTAGDQPR
jgi:AhpD family alkylhydroperoxidase